MIISKIEGNVVREPKSFQAGDKTLTVVDVACNYKESVTFVTLKSFNDLAYLELAKGDRVIGEGRFAVESSEKDGKTYTNYVVYPQYVKKLFKPAKREAQESQETQESPF